MSAQLTTTRAAEGLPRRRFTVREMEWMTHHDSSSEGYRGVRDHEPEARLVPLQAPGLAVSLSELRLH